MPWSGTWTAERVRLICWRRCDGELSALGRERRIDVDVARRKALQLPIHATSCRTLDHRSLRVGVWRVSLRCDKVERYLQEYRLAETFVDVEYDLQIWRFKLANDGYSCLELWRLPLRIVGAPRDRHSGLVPA